MERESVLPDRQDERVYNQVFKWAHQFWAKEAKYLPSPCNGTGSKFVLLSEHEPNEMCFSLTEVLRAWIITGDGKREISLAEHKALWSEAEGKSWPFALMMFHFLPDRLHIAIGSATHPRVGDGSIYKIISSESEVRLERDSSKGGWIS